MSKQFNNNDVHTSICDEVAEPGLDAITSRMPTRQTPMRTPSTRFNWSSRCQRLAIALVLAALSDAFPLWADEPIPLKDVVQQLLGELDANTLVERSRSERKLLELGPEILQLLPSPDKTENPSIREAIRRIRPKLERQAARESSVPFEVNLQGEQSLEEIVSTLQTQSRNRITFDALATKTPNHRLVVDWQKAQFWDCVDELCLKESLQWHFTKDSAEIRLSPGDGATSPSELSVQRFGAFRVSIHGIERRPIIGDERRKILRVSGRLAVEPRLRPLFVSMAVENLRATANQDRPLAVWNPGARYEFPVSDGSHEVPLQWDFVCLATDDLKTLSIRGRIDCQIAAATERVVFDQAAQTRGAVRRRGGVSVRLREIRFDPQPNDRLNADIGITVNYDNGGPAFESHRSWIFHNAVYLETKSGQRIAFTDFDVTQQSDGAITVDYHWRNIGGLDAQYLFVYEAPTLIIDVPIEIDLPKFLLNSQPLNSQNQQPPK